MLPEWVGRVVTMAHVMHHKKGWTLELNCTLYSRQTWTIITGCLDFRLQTSPPSSLPSCPMHFIGSDCCIGLNVIVYSLQFRLLNRFPCFYRISTSQYIPVYHLSDAVAVYWRLQKSVQDKQNSIPQCKLYTRTHHHKPWVAVQCLKRGV